VINKSEDPLRSYSTFKNLIELIKKNLELIQKSQDPVLSRL